jgi:Zn ribbon nucleic-acid-binding protein
MASAKKKSREELIAGGYCPTCSKCTASSAVSSGISGCPLYECRKCGTLLLEVSRYNDYLPHFVDVTEHWEEIWDWYAKRREEISRQISELEMQLAAELPGMLSSILAPSLPFRGLTLVSAKRLNGE